MDGTNEYCSVSAALADGVAFLVQSLGGVVRRGTKVLPDGALAYRVNVKLMLCPFALPRKVEHWRKPDKYLPTRIIVDIEPEGKAETTCIKVDSPDELFVADQFIVTHNTPQSLAALKLGNNFPAIVICPASLKRNWEREAKKWLPGVKVAVLTGQPQAIMHFDGTPAYDILIINYNSKILEKWVEAFIKFNPAAIVCDECHALKNSKAQQTKLVDYLIKNTKARRIFLSGTPVVNRPMEFWQLVKLLGYESFLGGYMEYKRRYDNSDVTRLQELNNRVRQKFFVRRLKKDVLTELPDKIRVTLPLDLDNRAEYLEAERDIAKFFAERKASDDAFKAEARLEAKVYAQRTGEPESEVYEKLVKAKYNAAYLVAAQNERLLRWEALKQVACRGKMKALHQWIVDFLENSDQKLVLFGSHQTFISEVVSKHAKYGAVMITGQTPVDARMAIVDRFQTDPKCRLIVGNMIAMGEGLTLTAASNVAFFEFGWNPKTHGQAEDRCHRIGQKDSVTVYNLIAEDTIDEEIVALVEAKRQVVDAIQDGAGADSQRRFMEELQARMELRRRGIRAPVQTLIDGEDNADDA